MTRPRLRPRMLTVSARDDLPRKLDRFEREDFAYLTPTNEASLPQNLATAVYRFDSLRKDNQ